MSRIWWIAIVLGLFVSAGWGEVVNDLMYLDGATMNLVSDNDAQQLFFDANGNGSLDPGDVIRGVIDVVTLNSTSANVGGMTGNNEWGAIFSLQVTATIPVDPGVWTIVFGPDAGFSGYLAGLDPFAPPAPVNTMVRFYEDPTPDADFTMSLAVAYDTAGPSFVGGPVPTASVFWDLGFAGAPGEGWVVAAGSLAFTVAAGVNPGTVIGNSNFAVSLLASYGLVAGTPGGLIGSSSIRGAMSSTACAGFDAESDGYMTFLAVPEPATLSLLGLGALAMLRRRRRG